MKYLVVTFLVFSVLTSCSKVRNCECKTTWVEYTQFGPVDREEIVAYPVKGNQKEAKTQCNIIATNQNNVDGYYTLCTVKK